MPDLTIVTDQFPDAISPDIQVGQNVQIVVFGRVRVIEEDLIDVTSFNHSPSFTAGQRKITIAVTVIEPT